MVQFHLARRRVGSALAIFFLGLGVALAGFCTQCGFEHLDHARFCARCGTAVAAAAPAAEPSAGPPAPPPTPEPLAVRIDLDAVQTSNREDALALGFLKTVLQGKPYLGEASRPYIYQAPDLRDLEVISKKRESARPGQLKFMYDVRLLARRATGDASWFGKDKEHRWEHWCLRIRRNPDKILSWLPKSFYDDPFVKRPRILGSQAAPEVFAEVSTWMYQGRNADKAARDQASEDDLTEYEVVYADRALTIDRGFPFLHDANVVTSLLHLAGSEVGGRARNLVALRLVNHLARPRQLRVRTTLQGVSHQAVESVAVPPGEMVEVGLTPAWISSALALPEKRPSAIHLEVRGEDGAVLYEATERVDLLSRNDFILEERLLPFIAAFVTPNDALVDQLITAAAERVTGRAMAGYQKSLEGVREEVRAIYETIAGLGVRYRSNTTSFLQDEAILAQRITYPAESLAGRGANCIDGAVLFASCFEALGLRASVVFGPGHAFVAVHTEPTGGRLLPIETTMVGTEGFAEAVDSAIATYNQWAEEGSLEVIDLPEAREAGITPFPFVTDSPLVADRLRQLAGE